VCIERDLPHHDEDIHNVERRGIGIRITNLGLVGITEHLKENILIRGGVDNALNTESSSALFVLQNTEKPFISLATP
jgi:hypothetical protein